MKRVWKCRRKGLGSVVVRRMPRCHRWSASATAASLPEGRKSGLSGGAEGNSLGLSSVSNFRTGRMPSVNRMIENLSDWDIDTSDSEGGGYGGRDSPKASPRDDKVANGGARHIYFANAPGNCNDRVVVGHHDSARVGLGNWYAVLSYDASVRLCLHSWARSYMRAPPFLENECSLLRDVLESYSCMLRLKSSYEEDALGMQPGPGEARVADIYDESVLDLDLMGRSVVSVLYPGKKSMKKLREIQLYINYSTTADKDSYKIPFFGESGITNYVLRPVHICSGNYRLRLCFGDCDERPTVSAKKLVVATWFVEMVGGFICIFSGVLELRYISYVMDISTATVDYLDLVHDILLPVVIKDKSPFSGRRLAAPALDPALKLYKWLHDILSPRLRNILLKSEEKLTRKDHSELVGEGAYVKSKKTIGKIRVPVRNVKMGTKQPTGFTFTSLKSSSTVKLETFQQRIIFLYVEIEKFDRRGCIGNATGTCLPGGFGDDLNLNYIVGMFLFRWLTFLMNRYLILTSCLGKKRVHICSRNYRLRLCFGDCDERPTVSAQKLVATWFVEMVGGFICIFSGVLDAYTKLRYLSYVMDISTATVDYLDLVHDILLPVVIKDKSPFSGRRLAAPALDPALKLYKWLHDILSPRLRNILLKSEEKLTRKDHSELVGEGAYVKSKKTIGKIRVPVRNVKMGTKQPTGFTFTSLKSSSTVKLETFQQRIIFLYVEIEKFDRRGCIGNATGTCLPGGFGDDLNLNYIVGMFLFRWLTFLMNRYLILTSWEEA
ncbi:hypothetical protein SASPL_154273 [Salvia splendens]|uniref:Uncharacterized protein n=1 Tax=Salvia splendens TaxID=180675 RepID=A0A8X8YZ58_SALSN|nr:hypothetical protein SASPL_154273 [Salvia splendens]